MPGQGAVGPGAQGQRSMGMDAMERDVVAALPALAYQASSRTDAWSFTAVQGGLLERLGTRAQDLCADPSQWVLMVHREDRERVVAQRRLAATVGRLELEYRVQTADGDTCWVHDVAVRDDRQDGAMFGIVTDVTEPRRAGDVLERLHDARLDSTTRLLRAVSVRDTTVQLFVHDMQSPLTAVAGLARTLRDRGEALPQQDRDRVFERMVAASDRVIALVEDFARFWGLPLDVADLPLQRVRLAPLVACVVDEVGADDDRVFVDVGDLALDTNGELLRRVLVGLVRNAVNHTPDGTAIRVSAMEDDDEGGVTIDVEDDGPGIADHLRGRLFEPRLRAATEGTGTGVGLSLVRAAVELLGGEVIALDSPAGGTIVRVHVRHKARTIVLDPAVSAWG